MLKNKFGFNKIFVDRRCQSKKIRIYDAENEPTWTEWIFAKRAEKIRIFKVTKIG